MKVTRLDEKISPIFPRVITTSFPKEKYLDLLHKLNFTELKYLNLEQHRKVFVNAIYLFLNGSWSQDELSAVADTMFYEVKDNSDELGDALYACAELTFTIRTLFDPDKPRDRGNFDGYMWDVMKFYEKHFDEVIFKESESVAVEAKKMFEKMGFKQS